MITTERASSTNKFDLYSRGMQALHHMLGSVDAEEFISLVKSAG